MKNETQLNCFLTWTEIITVRIQAIAERYQRIEVRIRSRLLIHESDCLTIQLSY